MKIVLTTLCYFIVAATFAQANYNVEKFANTITQKDLKQHLTYIAGNETEGRETATDGQRKAALYIEEQFKNLGLKPGNANSYYQYFKVYQDVLHSSSLKIYDANFSLNNHYTIQPNSTNNGSITINQIVFASYGLTDKTMNNYENIDIKGKWVMIIESNPEDIDKEKSGADSRKSFTKIKTALDKGAIGVLLVSKNFDNPKYSTLPITGSMYVKKQSNNLSKPIISISYQAAASILTKTIVKFSDLKNIATGTYTTQIVLNNNKETKTLESSNVVGFLEGTDKKEEFVVLTAHYDHLGKKGDVIYYGADDDGSGTVTIIEMAEAFIKAKKKGYAPRRSIVFMTVSGEEKGLWGSDYYTQHPIYPLAKTTVNLNIDMIGRIDPTYKGDSLNYVYIIGDDKLSSDLTPISNNVNKLYKLELDRKYNDPKDPNRFYYRSDHYNFAKNGVPVIFYFNGVHKDYHRPSDTVDKINFDVMTKRARYIFATAWEIANKNDMLKRDIPLNMPAR